MKAAIVEGTLAATMREALRLRDQMRADGATEVELAQALEQTVRAAWLFTRAWKYLCQACEDTGAVRHVCTPSQRCQGISTWIDNPHDTPGKYRRLCATSPDAEYEHQYIAPCDWCARGARFRPAPRKDFTDEAGASRKKLTRFGR